MLEERSDARAPIDEYVAKLKAVIPAPEHGALESRVDELINDPSADVDDILLIIREEFDPRQQ